MSLALDTNVLQALLEENHPLQERAVEALKRYRGPQGLLISPFVYAESFRMPNFDTELFHSFLKNLSIRLDANLTDHLWQRAGEAYAAYHVRRRKQKKYEQKRILTDFLIGAHATSIGASLLTFDPKGYQAAFPSLRLLP